MRAFCLEPFIMLIVLFWFWFALAGNANSHILGSLSASLDRDSASVGSMVTLSLSYGLPEGARSPKETDISGLGGLTIGDREVSPDQIGVRLLVDRLSSWRAGPLCLTYADVVEKDPQLRPIQGIVPTQALWLEYLPWAAGLLSILLIVLGLLWWYRRGRGKRRSIELEDPPHIWARKEIERLESRGLFEKGDVKEFYFLFSQILRRYLESLRGFPAAEFTTEEIARHIDNDQDRRLLHLLQHADLVKFADTIPTIATKEEELKEALSYIQETSPPVEINGQLMEPRGYSNDV